MSSNPAHNPPSEPWVKILGVNEWHYAPLESEHTAKDVRVACGVRVLYSAIERVGDVGELDQDDDLCTACETIAAKARK